MKILYIEDNPVDIDLTVRRIRKNCPQIEINAVKSQAEALNEIKKPGFSSYDLVLTDMHLQDGDGIAVLSHIRGHSIPVAVILLTGQGDEEAAVAALKAGADDYIVKKKGYLDRLPDLIENALMSYRKTKDIGIQTLKILYLEHNQADIDLTQRHLNQYAPHMKMDVINRVSDFYAILDQAESLSPYNAMLLDYRLPQENALEILKRIKSSPNSGIPVILVTGKGDEEIAVKALKLGAFDYLTKNQGYLFKLPSIIENAYYNRRLIREHQALAESESRYRSLFENNHVVMLLINPESGDIIDANSAASRFYGWSKQE
jgi:DNA-binding NtrC family response regulator